MLTVEDMRDIVDEISYLDWRINIYDEGDRSFLQCAFIANDLVTGEPQWQRSRKWFLSPHMTKSEVVSTALKAVLTAVEHEVRESFRYRGSAIFGPHFDVDALADFAKRADNLDMRTGAWVDAA